jgi:hypothetical protein
MSDNDMRGDKKPKHKGTMARVAKAISDSPTTQSFKSVKGYDKLPDAVKDTLEKRMEPAELATLGKLHDSLVEGGLFEDVEDEHGSGKVSFF